jgi:hypothetical protein
MSSLQDARKNCAKSWLWFSGGLRTGLEKITSSSNSNERGIDTSTWLRVSAWAMADISKAKLSFHCDRPAEGGA